MEIVAKQEAEKKLQASIDHHTNAMLDSARKHHDKSRQILKLKAKREVLDEMTTAFNEEVLGEINDRFGTTRFGDPSSERCGNIRSSVTSIALGNVEWFSDDLERELETVKEEIENIEKN